MTISAKAPPAMNLVLAVKIRFTVERFLRYVKVSALFGKHALYNMAAFK